MYSHLVPGTYYTYSYSTSILGRVQGTLRVRVYSYRYRAGQGMARWPDGQARAGQAARQGKVYKYNITRTGATQGT